MAFFEESKWKLPYSDTDNWSIWLCAVYADFELISSACKPHFFNQPHLFLPHI